MSKREHLETETDTSGVHLWLVLWKATRSLEAHAHRNIQGFGMGQSDFGVLEALLHRGPLSVKELGAKVLLTSGSMTAAERNRRRRSRVMQSGGRRIEVVLDAAAASCLEQILNASGESLCACLSRLITEATQQETSQRTSP